MGNAGIVVVTLLRGCNALALSLSSRYGFAYAGTIVRCPGRHNPLALAITPQQAIGHGPNADTEHPTANTTAPHAYLVLRLPCFQPGYAKNQLLRLIFLTLPPS